MKEKTEKIKKNKKTPTVKLKTRPSWDEYFIGMTDFVGSRSTCDRGKSGCIIVRDKRVVSTGYIGSSPGLSHCDEVGHEMHTIINEDGSRSQHCIRTVHAEQNAISQAARFGVALQDATLYCRMTPCYTCAKSIITAGIKRVVAKNDYHTSKRSKDIFKKSGVELDIRNKKIEKYPKQ